MQAVKGARMISNRRGACVELRRKLHRKLFRAVTSAAVLPLHAFDASAALDERLAPPPDFRYVGLDAGPRVQLGYLAGLLGAAATVGTGFACGFGSRGVIAAAIAATATTITLGRAGGPHGARGWQAHGVPMAIVPWGVLVHPEEKSRVLRWSGVARVDAKVIYRTDTGTPESLWSVVTVETPREKLSGRARGSVPLERLQVHVEAYARESSHVVALDLSGDEPGEGPFEPEVEPLLEAARAYIVGAPASDRLGLPSSGYRRTSAKATSARAVSELRAVLRDRVPKRVDPRAFAAVIAAELGATELVDDLLALIQCPHPVIAAVARVAAQKLGARSAHAGCVDEVAPFLMDQDVSALESWAVEPAT